MAAANVAASLECQLAVERAKNKADLAYAFETKTQLPGNYWLKEYQLRNKLVVAAEFLQALMDG